MTSLLETPPARGAATLEFEAAAARTALVVARAQAPLKVLQPRNRGDAAWACLSSLGGGLVDGDALSVRARAGRGAKAALTTQASTKVYRGSSSQTLRASVEAGGLLVCAPDPVTCFSGARYAQRLELEAAAAADLVVVDGLTSGRAARGERWAFASYEARLTVRRGGRDLLRDALRLSPEQGPLPARLGRWDLLATAVVAGPRLAEGARRLVERCAREPLARRPRLLLTAAPLGGDGAIVRLAAESVQQGWTALREALGFCWDLLGDDPWSARY